MDVTGQFRPKKCVTNNKEYTMKKQGFTLIELMVVIVIMGILAAVAVPKLFGMIAKSKASEIGPAAGEYVKLQDAFISETGTTWGSWQYIGYKMETTNNVFTYTEENKPSKGTATLGSLTAVWKAQPKANLNDCTSGAGYWELKLKKTSVSGGNGAQYKAHVKGDDCNVLVPGYGKLDATGAAQIDP